MNPRWNKIWILDTCCLTKQCQNKLGTKDDNVVKTVFTRN